jgi:vacuolar-type H+-ATPase subunit E/Vma4
MTGLDAIVAKIINDAQTSADARIASANERAQQIRADRRQISENRRELRLNSAADQVKRIEMRGLSSAKNENRALFLEKRNQLIDYVLTEALASLSDTPAHETFDIIKSKVLSCPIDQPASLILSEKDLKRVPKDFTEGLSQRTLFPVTIQPDPGSFTFGCIVVCGEVEYDYSAEGMLYERRDELRDRINRILFREESTGAN